MDVTYAEVGTWVILGRHTRGGDCCEREWEDDMERYVGRQTQITRINCTIIPSCYVSCDGGKYYWRVQDMILASDVPLLTIDEKIRRRVLDG